MLQPHEPIAGFVPAGAIFASCADSMRPPRRLSVSDCATEYRVLQNPGGGYSGPWQNSIDREVT